MTKASHDHAGCLSQKRLILLQPFIGLSSDKAQSEVWVKHSSNSWSQPCHYPFPSLHSTLQFSSFLASFLRQFPKLPPNILTLHRETADCMERVPSSQLAGLLCYVGNFKSVLHDSVILNNPFLFFRFLSF